MEIHVLQNICTAVLFQITSGNKKTTRNVLCACDGDQAETLMATAVAETKHFFLHLLYAVWLFFFSYSIFFLAKTMSFSVCHLSFVNLSIQWH